MIKQQQALLETEGVQMEFTDAAIREISRVAEEVSLALPIESCKPFLN
jgi:ATP-dependent HslUV protease ATP-binding subunit HslU